MSDPERKKAQGREGRAKKKAMTIPCAVCGARPGEPCGRESDRTRNIHLTRYEDYLSTVGKLAGWRRV